MVSKLKTIYGEDINKYLLLAFAQLSCILAGFLDLATVLHILSSQKSEVEKGKRSSSKIVFLIVLGFSVSIAACYIIKYNILPNINWFPLALFIHSAASLIVFLIEFLLPIKKAKSNTKNL